MCWFKWKTEKFRSDKIRDDQADWMIGTEYKYLQEIETHRMVPWLAEMQVKTSLKNSWFSTGE